MGEYPPYLAQKLSMGCVSWQAEKGVLGQNKNMCVSDFMGLQNRVGRSGIFFFAIFFYCPLSEILDKFWLKNLITSLKVVRFT